MQQIAVIGLGRFGTGVALTLANAGHDVLGADVEESCVQYVADALTEAIQMDIMDEASVRELGLQEYDAVVLALGDMEASIIGSMVLMEIGCENIFVKAASELHARILKKIGVKHIVQPERDSGIKLAHTIMGDALMDHIDLSPEYGIVELAILPTWAGKTLKELDIREAFGLNVLAIKREKDLILSPEGKEMLKGNDKLIVIGKYDDISVVEQKQI